MTCVGVLVADVIVRPVDQWPHPGSLALVERIELHSGGLAHTTGVVLAKLGVATAVVGRVGADRLGAFLVDVLRQNGIEAYVPQDTGASTSATVVVVASSGDRSFLHMPGANVRLHLEDVPEALLARSRIVHLGGYFLLPGLDGEPAAALLRRAKALGCRTSLDTAWDAHGRWMSALAPCLPYVDVLFGNRAELAHVTGFPDPPAMATALRELGVGTVAVKLGEEGAYVDDGSWRGRVPAFFVDVVDTTGAGDAFCGGFLAGYLAGWDAARAARLGNAVGAMCVTAMGGSTGVRSMAEAQRFADTTPLRA
ncbi:MAG: carbohydrate kinase family protein [Armatimonadota bacterium]|nr:carbohydrate kinase family protein [Armatimonadota bacterium]